MDTDSLQAPWFDSNKLNKSENRVKIIKYKFWLSVAKLKGRSEASRQNSKRKTFWRFEVEFEVDNLLISFQKLVKITWKPHSQGKKLRSWLSSSMQSGHSSSTSKLYSTTIFLFTSFFFSFFRKIYVDFLLIFSLQIRFFLESKIQMSLLL